jgi:arylsulfatase A-like enzyme
MKRFFLSALFVWSALNVGWASAQAAAAKAATTLPNILLFLAHDLGYADIGVNGCKDIPTPNIDSFARNGVRFTDGYAAHPVCSPSRAALMSGMYPHRFGFEHNSGPERFAAPNFGQPREVPTLAERLKAAGYATGMVGKWHIGFAEGLRPHERGFDHTFVFHSGARSFFPEKPPRNPLYRNGQTVAEDFDYLTDAFAREAVEFVGRSKGRPFFLYFPFNAVHSPLEASDKYQARFAHIPDKKRRTYAGMLSALDDAIGSVMAKVRELGQEENTLVMFNSDNGGPTTETSSSNDPLRGFKGQMYEGGIRVPFVMQWKGTIPAGQTYREMIMGFDYHATALAAAGAAASQPPATQTDRAAGKPPLPALDGVDLIPFLTGKQSGRPHEQLFWRGGRQHAARVGDWKLVQARGGEAALFNLKDDIRERDNLAASQPAKLKELQAAFAEWEKGTQPAKWVRQDQRNAEPGGKLKTPPASPPKGKAKAGAAASRVDDAFKAADKNNDGKLSRDELPAALFDRLDANMDGFVTEAELVALWRR